MFSYLLRDRNKPPRLWLYHKRGACHYRRTAAVPLFFSILLISSIHFCVNWVFEVVLSPLLKTLLQIFFDFSLFVIISPLSRMAIHYMKRGKSTIHCFWNPLRLGFMFSPPAERWQYLPFSRDNYRRFFFCRHLADYNYFITMKVHRRRRSKFRDA